MSFGVEVGSVAGANRNVVPKKELTQWLLPGKWREQNATAGDPDLFAGEADGESRLVLAGVGDDDAMMRDKTQCDRPRNSDLPGDRNGLADVLILR